MFDLSDKFNFYLSIWHLDAFSELFLLHRNSNKLGEILAVTCIDGCCAAVFAAVGELTNCAYVYWGFTYIVISLLCINSFGVYFPGI